MRVLMQIRSDSKTFGGGDVQQMKGYAEALNRMGIEVVCDSGLSVQYSSFDLVHLFNTTRINDTFQYYQAARKANRKIVLTPIWHSLNEMCKFYCRYYKIPVFPINAYSGLREFYYARRSRFPLAWRSVFKYYGSQQAVVMNADAVLVNSAAELGIIREDLGVEPKKSFVVPNGFDSKQISELVVNSTKRKGIVCAGRIEPRKNQCRIISGFKRLNQEELTIQFYGAINTAHSKYVAEFRQMLVPGAIEYKGLLDQGELYKRFATAEAVVLASYFETTGLVALEALACGAKIIVSDTPYTREYFRDYAFYCDPYSEESIFSAFQQALSAPVWQQPKWLNNFSWDKTAELTLSAYNNILNR